VIIEKEIKLRIVMGLGTRKYIDDQMIKNKSKRNQTEADPEGGI
jgi:hypothetical protein